MMLCIEGTDIASLVLALGERAEDGVRISVQEHLPRRLGDELAVIEEFLLAHHAVPADIHEFGIVRGPGSAGALRGVMSLVNAWALVQKKDIFSVTREGNRWSCDVHAKPYVFPIYDRPAHTTVSSRDALHRKV